MEGKTTIILFLLFLLVSLKGIYAEIQSCPVYLESNIQYENEGYLLIILNLIFGSLAAILMYIYFKRFR